MRQGVVLVAGLVAVLGLLAGVGAFGGTPVGEVGDGDLAPDASLVVPAGIAFSIWTPVYVGLAGLAVWQLAPGRRAHPRLRAAGWPLAVSMVANGAWIAAAQAEAYWLSVAVIVVILVSLAVAFARLVATGPPLGRVEAVLLDGTTGLYLGWVTLATVANVSTTLVQAGFADLAPGRTVWAVGLLGVAGAIGVTLTWVGLHHRSLVGFPVALAWGLTWVAVARLTGEPASAPAAVTAALAALAVVAAAVVRLSRPSSSSRDLDRSPQGPPRLRASRP